MFRFLLSVDLELLLIKADNFESVEKGTVDLTLTFADKEECSYIVLQLAVTLLQDVTPSGVQVSA